MSKTKKIDLSNLQTVAQYAARKRTLTRESIYYYCRVGRLESERIGGVLFIVKGAKIQPKKKKPVKKKYSKLEKRTINAKKYLSNKKAA